MRLRDLAGILLGVGAVVALAYGGWNWLSSTMTADPDPFDEARAVAQDYLDAWEAGDHDALTALVREPPEDLVARHAQLREGLEVRALRIDGGEADVTTEGRFVQPVTVEVDSALVDEPLRWDTELRLLRERGTWGVDWSLSTIHPELRPTWTFGWEAVEVDREPILAVDGTQLAGPGTQVSIGFQPALVRDPDAVVRAFALALPGSEVAAERELSRPNLNPDWYYPVVTVTQERADRARPTLRQAAGIIERQQSASRVLYGEDFARHVVGVVAEATAEQLQELGEPFEAGDVVGQFGLEQRFERELLGSERIRVGLRDGPEGELRVVLAEGQENPSRPLRTTLDVGIQRAVENALLGVEGSAAIVVVDGQDGAIRASASRPLGGFNRAFSGRYPPGSAFKIVTAEALLATGVVPDDEVSCPATTVVGGLSVPNAGGRALGVTTVERAFAASCNTTFAALGAGLGDEAMAAAAQRFGFGVEPLVPLAAFGGSFPEPVDTAELAAASFGQARVEASPLHMASVAAAAATGTWFQPYLLEDEGPGERRALATGAREPLRLLLRAVVAEGTGSAAEVEGQDVLGKTGTAQGPGGVEHAWFVGAWGDLGFAILVEEGGAGSAVAAPIAARLVNELVAITSGQADPGGPGDPPAPTMPPPPDGAPPDEDDDDEVEGPTDGVDPDAPPEVPEARGADAQPPPDA